MCGRACCTLRPDDVPRACGVDGSSIATLQAERYRPSYNVSPGYYLPVLRQDEGQENGVVVDCMKWGLVPKFTKKTEKPDHFRMFNAQSESIAEKASFRRLIPNKRCLVAVEGFYEWKKDGSKKQPYYIHFKDQNPLVFAALYDSWANAEGEILHTFTILTTRCSSTLEWLHDRMPVILGSKSSKELWLYGSPSTKFDNLLVPYEETDLVWYPVTPEMGKTTFNGPECIKEIKLKFAEKNPITKFFTKRTVDNKQPLALQEEAISGACVLPSDASKNELPKAEATSEERVLPNDAAKNEPPKAEATSEQCSLLNNVSKSMGGAGTSGRLEGGNETSPREPYPANALETVKEENKAEGDRGRTDIKQEASPNKDAYGGIKRDYEVFVAGSLASDVGTRRAKSSSKKGGKTGAGSGQPTIHSYFVGR